MSENIESTGKENENLNKRMNDVEEKLLQQKQINLLLMQKITQLESSVSVDREDEMVSGNTETFTQTFPPTSDVETDDSQQLNDDESNVDLKKEDTDEDGAQMANVHSA